MENFNKARKNLSHMTEKPQSVRKTSVKHGKTPAIVRKYLSNSTEKLQSINHGKTSAIARKYLSNSTEKLQ